MDHEILLRRLKSIGLSSHVIPCFKNDLSGRIQCLQAESKLLEIAKGVPQGSVLRPTPLYADDSVMYCSASSGQQALYKLQSAFNVIQSL